MHVFKFAQRRPCPHTNSECTTEETWDRLVTCTDSGTTRPGEDSQVSFGQDARVTVQQYLG